MTFAREKRLLLGLAALLAPLPLPFNQMLEWPALALFEAGVVALLVRAARGADGPEQPERWLSNRALNLLGLAYLPLLVLDIAATGRIQMLRPVLHLALFGVAAKLWSLRGGEQNGRPGSASSSSSSPRWRPASIRRSSSISSPSSPSPSC